MNKDRSKLNRVIFHPRAAFLECYGQFVHDRQSQQPEAEINVTCNNDSTALIDLPISLQCLGLGTCIKITIRILANYRIARLTANRALVATEDHETQVPTRAMAEHVFALQNRSHQG